MITISAEDLRTSGTFPLAAAEWFRMANNVLWTKDNEQLAIHNGGYWRWDQYCTTVLRVDTPAVVRFRDEAADRISQSWGPYPFLRFADGALRTGEQYSQMLARLEDSTGLWHVAQDGSSWPVLMIYSSALAK